MYIIDPIADMLTRIRNANVNKDETVLIPTSKMKLSIAEILLKEGFISAYKTVKADKIEMIEVSLKYGPNGERVINGLKRISKPGLRSYTNAEKMPEVLSGLGIAIVSTNKGVMTGKEAKKLNVGGEVLAFVW